MEYGWNEIRTNKDTKQNIFMTCVVYAVLYGRS